MGTLTDLHHWRFHPNHLTTLSHFFTKSSWDEERLLGKLQEWILRRIGRLVERKNQPLFVSIDDTICQKTRPSSRATHAIEGCDWHYSHNDHQSVWGHSLVWLMVHTFTQAFPFAFRLYDKKAGRSKIDLVIEMLSSIKEKLDQPVYVLMDSWHPSQTLIEACLKKDSMSSRGSRRTGFSTRKASPSKRSRLPAMSSPKSSASSRWVRSVAACIAMRGRSMAPMTRWCCCLGRWISRWRRNISIASRAPIGRSGTKTSCVTMSSVGRSSAFSGRRKINGS